MIFCAFLTQGFNVGFNMGSKESKTVDPLHLPLSYSEWQVLLLLLSEVNEELLCLLDV